ncbi:acetylcholinesterase [Plectosphaerella cucumerina]|uniref:Carboxylic ester hydrolase n=1 Tax=Plectosphaerella cucumerina TaxID=40658 RepID=A0A8K0X904_9PEZI|nr:acetylcholinesterase [Plectosphaerella cucumerina]
MKIPRAGLRRCWPYLLPVALFLSSVLWLGRGLDLHFFNTHDDNPWGLPLAHVDLGYARYTGNVLPNGVRQFLGLRYAAPPVGNLRWRAPERPSYEARPQPASRFGWICYPSSAGFPFDGHSEDCLFANVWAPDGANSSSKLPVWVFIQGGGYSSLANWNWNGSNIVARQKNVVFVNFNYRVGLFGFLASHKIRRDGHLNTGLLDQRRALEWVKEHIAQFGGDPDHVVIHGVSAGAGSVAMQLLAYGGRTDDLFVGAIADATFFPPQPRLDDAEVLFDRVVQEVGCHDAGDQLSCLRTRDTETLQNANLELPFPGRPERPIFYWSPCVDDDFLTDYPYLMFEKGDFARVPVMFGTSTDEGSVFAPDAASSDHFVEFMKNQFHHLDSNETDDMLRHYPLKAPLPQHNAWFPSASQAYGEATFICPSNAVMDALVGPGTASPEGKQRSPAPAWSYRFNVIDNDVADAGLGVPHVFDAAAVMGPGMIPTPSSYFTYNAPVVPLLSGYYHSFVRSLDPNPHRASGAPEWPAWASGETRLVVETGGETRFEPVSDGQRDRCEFWEGLAEITEQSASGSSGPWSKR